MRDAVATVDLGPVRFGLLFGLLAVLYGWGLGLVFGVNEDGIRKRFIADAESSRAIYLQKAGSEEGATAAIKRIDECAWRYFLRAHLHAGGISAIAIGASVVLSLLSVGRGAKMAPHDGRGAGSSSDYWGLGPPDDLARGLRAALDQTQHEPATSR